MAGSSSYAVLLHYGRRYMIRFLRVPKKKDLKPVLARALIVRLGSVESAIRALDLWFDSPDPWYASQGFALKRCLGAINRLIATGDLEPRGISYERERIFNQCVPMFWTPQLRIARRGRRRRRRRESES